MLSRLQRLLRPSLGEPSRKDQVPRVAATMLRHVERNQRVESPAAEHLEKRADAALKRAREVMLNDRREGHKHQERLDGSANFPTYWKLAYAAGRPLHELAANVDEYLDQLAYFDEVFSHVWRPARRIVEVQYRLDDALEGLTWLVGLGAPRAQIRRFLDYCGPPGQDALFDRIVCKLGEARTVASALQRPTEFQPLLALTDAAPTDRAQLAADALRKWSRAQQRGGVPSEPDDVGYVGLWHWPLALVVMAWDVDDQLLRDSPHYPRDLVTHARRHGIKRMGDGISPTSASQPSPAATVPGPLQGQGTSAPLGRWLALVCDGDAAARIAGRFLADTEPVLGVQPRQLFSCLSEQGQALYADGKDDATLSAQCQALVSRRIPDAGFDADTLVGDQISGALRCEALISGLRNWLLTHGCGWRLVQVDQGQDDWMAVLIRADRLEEWERLSRDLGLAGQFI